MHPHRCDSVAGLVGRQVNESDVEVKDFSFKYRDTKRRAVKHVDFQVEEGSFFTIIGANGAGKSTLCNALVGLIPHYFVGAGLDTS